MRHHETLQASIVRFAAGMAAVVLTATAAFPQGQWTDWEKGPTDPPVTSTESDTLFTQMTDEYGIAVATSGSSTRYCNIHGAEPEYPEPPWSTHYFSVPPPGWTETGTYSHPLEYVMSWTIVADVVDWQRTSGSEHFARHFVYQNSVIESDYRSRSEDVYHDPYFYRTYTEGEPAEPPPGVG